MPFLIVAIRSSTNYIVYTKMLFELVRLLRYLSTRATRGPYCTYIFHLVLRGCARALGQSNFWPREYSSGRAPCVERLEVRVPSTLQLPTQNRTPKIIRIMFWVLYKQYNHQKSASPKIELAISLWPLCFLALPFQVPPLFLWPARFGVSHCSRLSELWWLPSRTFEEIRGEASGMTLSRCTQSRSVVRSFLASNQDRHPPMVPCAADLALCPETGITHPFGSPLFLCSTHAGAWPGSRRTCLERPCRAGSQQDTLLKVMRLTVRTQVEDF